MSQPDVLVENPAWVKAREALKTIDDGQSKQDKPPQQEQPSQQIINQPPNFMSPPPSLRPMTYNYSQSYYPPHGFYGGYNQSPGPYPYSPYNHQYDSAPSYGGRPTYRPERYPVFNQGHIRPPHIPHANYMQSQPTPPQQSPHQLHYQQYDPTRPTGDGSKNEIVYQKPEVQYKHPNNEGYAGESSKKEFKQAQSSSNSFQRPEYPSHWQEASQEKTIQQQPNQNRTYADVIKNNEASNHTQNQFVNKRKPSGGNFKMTFINASGTKKFKPAWQPVEAKPADVEEKENSSRYELESNGQQNLNSQSEEKKAQLPADEGQQKKNSREWPPTLKTYVRLSFDRCKTEPEKDCLEKHFKELLTRVLEDGTAYTTEWDKYPFPNLEELMNKKRMQKPWKRRSRSNERNRSRSVSRSRSRSPVWRRNNRKERHSDSMRGTPGRGRGKKRGRGRGRGQKIMENSRETPKNNGKNWISSSPPSSPDMEDAEVSKRKKNRANRFHETLREVKDSGKMIASTLNVYQNADGEEDFDWSQFHIVGTCQDMTKRYLRLTSAPDPAMVRPQDVLKKSLEMVKQKWKSKPDYHFTCEQLKAIRQDLTVQGIRNDFTVEVYEIHARIALEKGDREEFNQCQTCLKSLYKEGRNGHPDEFTAYKIIYDIYTDNYLDMSNCLVSSSAELKKSDAVKHALALRSAWVLCNYHYFFQLYLTAPNMSGYLIDLFAERVRKQALKIMFKSYRPSLPIKFIESELAFTDDGACTQWLKELGATFTTDTLSIDTKASTGIFNSS